MPKTGVKSVKSQSFVYRIRYEAILGFVRMSLPEHRPPDAGSTFRIPWFGVASDFSQAVQGAGGFHIDFSPGRLWRGRLGGGQPNGCLFSAKLGLLGSWNYHVAACSLVDLTIKVSSSPRGQNICIQL